MSPPAPTTSTSTNSQPRPQRPQQAPVLIIGAGVAGLVLAQGLRLRRVPVRVFERQPLSARRGGSKKQGHRFRISSSPSSSSATTTSPSLLGGKEALDGVLAPSLRAACGRAGVKGQSFAPRYVDPRVLEYAARTEMNDGGKGSVPVDRSWLVGMLAASVDGEGEGIVEYGKEFISYEVVHPSDSNIDQQKPAAQQQQLVRVRFSDGTTVLGRLLVGADGVRSRVRGQLQPERRLLDLERWVVWGRTPLTAELKRELPGNVLTWCMYLDSEANAQAVVEPMTWTDEARREAVRLLSEEKEGKKGVEAEEELQDYVYWVICTAAGQYAPAMPRTAGERRLYVERATGGWHGALRRLLVDAADHDVSACAPVLSSKPDIELDSRNNGPVTLVGDAAHAMSPMGGSGADTAIRNAADLAETIAEEGVGREAVSAFETRMAERARERILHSFKGGQKFWKGKGWTEYGNAET